MMDRNEKVVSKDGKKLSRRIGCVVGATLRSDVHCHTALDPPLHYHCSRRILETFLGELASFPNR